MFLLEAESDRCHCEKSAANLMRTFVNSTKLVVFTKNGCQENYSVAFLLHNSIFGTN